MEQRPDSHAAGPLSRYMLGKRIYPRAAVCPYSALIILSVRLMTLYRA
jgi:hypothetical protein